MSDGLLPALGYALLAGLAILAGAGLARYERLLPGWLDTELRHAVNALVGGVLLAAVALVLVPHGTDVLSPLWVVVGLTGGGLLFLVIDRALAATGAQLSVLMAMLLDFVPEAMALGALLATGAPEALLLAILIGVQNLPEGFTSFRELTTGKHRTSQRAGLALMAGCALLGPLAALGGLLWLADRPQTLGAITLVASGGILYLTFQDIAPAARLRRAWAPPLGAVLGFQIGVIGQMLVG
ncbi:divalent cation transporter [Roseospira navarrensis]|uniref:Divalent cation transporter n=1 Tax=Roseospira navarrensis TaxID=140058 RepID=A0A7X1ZDW3_9PROT|nr:divalent cation transporter [Roseospira navarrensis]MQX36749.1 divalent cation transporter [Roseospira navarrensis]